MNYWNSKEVNLADIVGKTFVKVEQIENESIRFEDSDGEVYEMYHDQYCCESVYIEDVCGDLQDLVGSPILLAEEVSNTGSAKRNWDTNEVTIEGEWPEGVDKPEYGEDSYTWTFYKMATNKGSVTIRWYGSSNGYYSESVSFSKGKKDENNG